MDEKTKIGEFGKCCLFSEEGEVVNEFVAGSRGTWKIEYTAGSSGINRGGGIVIVPPCRSITRWEVGHVEACKDTIFSLMNVPSPPQNFIGSQSSMRKMSLLPGVTL